uniref:Uncharacterized protein n=1 Tax=Octactis speculum TaxID=3111310 RepID=A0A7S2MET7_9STRA
MPGSVKGAPAGRSWLIAFFSRSVPNVATIPPTAVYGAIKSRRINTVVVTAAVTSHFVEAFSLKTTRVTDDCVERVIVAIPLVGRRLTTGKYVKVRTEGLPPRRKARLVRRSVQQRSITLKSRMVVVRTKKKNF